MLKDQAYDLPALACLEESVLSIFLGFDAALNHNISARGQLELKSTAQVSRLDVSLRDSNDVLIGIQLRVWYLLTALTHFVTRSSPITHHQLHRVDIPARAGSDHFHKTFRGSATSGIMPSTVGEPVRGRVMPSIT